MFDINSFGVKCASGLKGAGTVKTVAKMKWRESQAGAGWGRKRTLSADDVSLSITFLVFWPAREVSVV